MDALFIELPAFERYRSYWWPAGQQFWLFTLYGKEVQDDLTPRQRQALKHLLEREHLTRTTNATQHLH